jgi:hypothetical protein
LTSGNVHLIDTPNQPLVVKFEGANQANMGCGPSSEAGATGASNNATSASKSSSVAGANAGKKFGDSYKLGKEASLFFAAALLRGPPFSNLGCC